MTKMPDRDNISEELLILSHFWLRAWEESHRGGSLWPRTVICTMVDQEAESDGDNIFLRTYPPLGLIYQIF